MTSSPAPLGEDELDLAEPAATRWLRAVQRKWPTALIVALVLVVGYSLRAPVGTWIVKRGLQAATTPGAEVTALCRMNEWARQGHARGYELRAFDSDGEQLQPTHDGRYDQIATLLIIWTDGTQVSRDLLGHDGLACAYHG